VPPELSVHTECHDNARTMQLRGRLGRRGLAAVEAELTELLTHEGTVVCDLGGLDYLSPRGVALLVEMQSERPPTPPALALCAAASGQVMRTLAAIDPQRMLPLFRTVQDARREMLREHRRAALVLTPDPEAPGRSRTFAAGVCAQWSLHAITDDVVLVVSELVTNAVVHARTNAELQLAQGRAVLTVAVADHAAILPRAEAAEPLARTGRGLLLVTRLADAFGSYRRQGGGKVVWCALRLAAA
jgi:anti-sigma regulatory factor (Ser/Thr protein kinase)/ABC-type transporter Mla MlaB component